MVNVLVRHTVLNPSQRAFLKARSSLKHMLPGMFCLEEITKWIDEDIIYLDFQKAFSKVPH